MEGFLTFFALLDLLGGKADTPDTLARGPAETVTGGKGQGTSVNNNPKPDTFPYSNSYSGSGS
jgi:hypothetical protein